MKSKPAKTVRTYSASATITVHIEVELGAVEAATSAEAKKHFRDAAQSIVSDSGKLDLMRHSTLCGIDLADVYVRRG